MSDSVMNNIDSVIRFLYLYSHGNSKLFKKGSTSFEEFMRGINTSLSGGSLKYQYICEYDGNILLIGTADDNNSVRIVPQEFEYLPLIATSTFIKIKNGSDYLEINRNYLTDIAYNAKRNKPKNVVDNFSVKFTFNGVTSSIGAISEKTITDFFSKKKEIYSRLQDLSKALEENDASELHPQLPPEEFEALYDEFTPTEIPQQQSLINPTTIIFILIIVGILGALSKFFPSRSGGGNENNILDKVLGADFDILYDSSTLLENNITTMYFLFSMLAQYELSFVNYQEGIDTYYTKIDESAILTDMVGITNLIPHNIELYVFLKLILNDYSEANVSKNVNYSLLEYYLYLYSLSNKNILYSRLQNLKSYLNINYTIDVNPEKIPDIIKKIKSDPVTFKSWRYFISVMNNAEEITNQVIAENYDAEQAGNFDIIYQNVEKYNLKLAGFTDMKNDFISKTFNIVSSMASAGLLTKYTEIANRIAGQTPGDVARGVTKPYQMVPTHSMMQQPISVGVGGKKYKKSLRKLRKVRKRTHKRKINNKTKKHRK